jgi:hypothetical protein
VSFRSRIASPPAAPCLDFGQLEHEIVAWVRRTDVLVRWNTPNGIAHFGVFCPFTNAQGAKELESIAISSNLAPHPVRGGAATFPLDGLVLDDLIDLALMEACGPHDVGDIEKSARPRGCASRS